MMRAQTLAGIVSVGALLFGFGEVAMSQTSQPGNVRNVVLVHGGWVDGSGWEGVYKALKKSGYAVTIVQEATTSLAGAPVPPILPPVDGYLLLDKAKFPASFAGDVSPEKAAFMADSQVPWGVNALGATISEPAWRTKPSWYLLTTEDKMIPVAAQRLMAKRASSTVVEVKGSHAIFVSQPQAVASVIEKAAKGVQATAAR